MVTVDAIQNRLQFEVRIIRQVDQKFAPDGTGPVRRDFKNVLELEGTIEKYS